jgi:phospholipid/cholesterol/gamma-HCH transport system substrate-binding protein
METRANYILIGSVTLALFVLGAIFAMWLGSMRFNPDYDIYDIRFEAPVRGLEIGGEVRFNGIKVGEVEDLRLDPKNPEVVIARARIRARTPVRTDSFAQLEPLGLTGLSYVQIIAGAPASRLMREGAGFGAVLTLPSRRGQLDRLFQGGEGVVAASLRTLAEAAEVLKRAGSAMDDRNLAAFSRTLANLEKTTAIIARNEALLTESSRAASALAEAGTTLASAARTYDALGSDVSGRVATLSEESTAAVREVQAAAAALRVAADEVAALAKTANQTADSATGALDLASAETLPDVARAARDLSRASASLEALTRSIEANPASFVQGDQKQRVEWRR